MSSWFPISKVMPIGRARWNITTGKRTKRREEFWSGIIPNILSQLRKRPEYFVVKLERQHSRNAQVATLQPLCSDAQGSGSAVIRFHNCYQSRILHAKLLSALASRAAAMDLLFAFPPASGIAVYANAKNGIAGSVKPDRLFRNSFGSGGRPGPKIPGLKWVGWGVRIISPGVSSWEWNLQGDPA
jgi:hypothetical protein